MPKKADPAPFEIKPAEAKSGELAPAIAAKPSEDNYEEDLYTMHNGENYATISKLHYRSETYAAASKNTTWPTRVGKPITFAFRPSGY